MYKPWRIYLMRPSVGEEELKAVADVFKSKMLTEGSFTRELENIFASYVEAKHAIAVSSCTTALEICLRVCKVGSGDEVIVPDYTHPATALAVKQIGGKVVLVDVDRKTRNVTAEHMKKAVSSRTKAVIPVSQFGYPLDLEVYELCKDLGVPLIEDAACSIGSTVNGRKVGSIGDFACFSLHPRKIITSGEGGVITTSNEEYAEMCRAYKNFGYRDGVFQTMGTNFKLPNILAAIGLTQLRRVEDLVRDRVEKAETYTNLLSRYDTHVEAPYVAGNVRFNYQSYCIYVKKQGARDHLRTRLAEKGVETQIGTYSLHLQPSLTGEARAGSLSNSEDLYRNVLTLPLHHELTEEQQKEICELIGSFLQG